jgi:hypothetical protein
MKDTSYRVALGGIITSLCLMAMFLAGIMPILYIVFPMIAGVLMMIMSIEVNTKWALLTYLSVSLLSMIITFDKESALIFVMFFGHYPILRTYIEKLKSAFLRNLIRIVLFNLCIIAYFYVTVYIFGLSEILEEQKDLGKYGAWIMLVVSDIIFLLYDYNLSLCYSIYKMKIMPKFGRKN